MLPTAEHEALHRVFQRDEALFTRAMARVFNIEVPESVPDGVTVLSTDLTETDPLERHPDSVMQAEFLVQDRAGRYILVIESQTEPDDGRRSRWPHFIAHLHDKYGCPVILAVVCSKRYTARWAREPIEIGLPGVVCQVIYAQQGLEYAQACINNGAEGQTPVEALTNADGVATFTVHSQTAGPDPVYFEANLVSPSQFYPYGYSPILTVRFRS